ncbi:MAG: hypothetical protein FJ197_05720 [Gammaproteobacteria bacterium]|nr:hypothetical protein [Gammaproteobacteria bacterium]
MLPAADALQAGAQRGIELVGAQHRAYGHLRRLRGERPRVVGRVAGEDDTTMPGEIRDSSLQI